MKYSAYPDWYRTPLVQTIALGVVFFFVFASYTTIQFYARTTYGEELAADCVGAVYASFTVSCLVAPSITNRWGSQCTMFLGILGYATLVVASLIYFLCPPKQQQDLGFIVVGAGVVLGTGAALLWTGQGRLILDYSTRIGHQQQQGTLLGIFWAVFQCSAIVGGTISFVYFSRTRPTGSVALYLIFLTLILLGAIATQFLLPPSALVLVEGTGTSPEHRRRRSSFDDLAMACETTSLLPNPNYSVCNNATDPISLEDLQNADLFMKSGEIEDEQKPSTTRQESWSRQAKETVRIFFTKEMLTLSILFFYTGYNQPYQQATFGNRFFTKRTIGIELIIFHLMEIVGAIYCGRALDRHDGAYTAKQDKPRGRRQAAISCLILFTVVNTFGNAVAYAEESSNLSTGEPRAVDITDWSSFWPSLSFACWGFADSQIQVYCYWLMGVLFESGDDHSRAVAFYKCLQSLGVSIGFYVTPSSRLTAISQLSISSTVYVAGTVLAFLQLPPESELP